MFLHPTGILPVGYQKYSLWFAFGGVFGHKEKHRLISRKSKRDNKPTTKDSSQTEEAVPPTEYEHNSSLRVNLLHTFPNLDYNVWLFNYRVSSTEIKLGAFIFVLIVCGTSPATHFIGESPRQVKMAQLSLPASAYITNLHCRTNDEYKQNYKRPSRLQSRHGHQVSMVTFFFAANYPLKSTKDNFCNCQFPMFSFRIDCPLCRKNRLVLPYKIIEKGLFVMLNMSFLFM